MNKFFFFRMDHVSGSSILKIFKKTKTHSVENSILVVGVEKALLIGKQLVNRTVCVPIIRLPKRK